MHIAIVYPFGYIDAVPAVVNLIKKLAEQNNRVTLFTGTPSEGSKKTHFSEATVTHYELADKSKKNIFFRKLPNIVHMLPKCISVLGTSKPDLIIGVDPAGLALAYFLSVIFRKKLIYYSLELIISTDKNRDYRGYKPIEAFASKRANYVLIQDEMRAKLLAEDNKLNLKIFHFLPNSPLQSDFREDKGKYFHKKFGLPENTKVLLCAGSIAEWTGSQQLASIAENLPETWVLVFHSRIAIPKDDVLAYLNANNSRKLLISDEPVNSQDLHLIFGSCDIGVALYPNTSSPNIKYMGKSTGKVNAYLGHGKPVIMNVLPGWEDWLDKYHSGICIDEVSEIPDAVKHISTHYEEYVAGAKLHFSEDLVFDRFFDNFYQAIQQSC